MFDNSTVYTYAAVVTIVLINGNILLSSQLSALGTKNILIKLLVGMHFIHSKI